MNTKININAEILTLISTSKTKIFIREIKYIWYCEGFITLNKAAELADIIIGEFVNLLINYNVIWSEYTVEKLE